MPVEKELLSRRDTVKLLGLSAVAMAAPTAAAAANPDAAPAQNAPQSHTPMSKGNGGLETAAAIADAIRSRQTSALEVLEFFLQRIDARNKELNAFIYLDVETARKRAREIDARIARGEDPGPLAGVPVGVKDLDRCAGMPGSEGSLLFKNGPPAKSDAPHIARLRHAGAVFVGKTAAPEFGLHSITASRAWGVTRNPWNLALSPGGSSGGSAAALASGMIPLATGSDGGGSIRSPAAFTGLIGHKVSTGRVGGDSAGDIDVNGCLSLNVRDTARVLDVIAGPTALDRTSLPKVDYRYEQIIETLDVAGLRAAWSPDYGCIPTEPECIDVAHRAAATLVRAAKLRWVERPFTPPNPFDAWVPAALIQLRGELKLAQIWPEKKAQLTEFVAELLSRTPKDPELELARATQARAEVEAETARLFEDVDVLFTPVTALVSLPAQGPIPDVIAGRDARHTGAEAHSMLVNMCWLPAISVPAGRSASGFPIGLQIICRRGRDDVALRLARVLEQAQPWPHLAPRYRT